MKNLIDFFLGTKHLLGVGTVILAFLLIVIGQTMHENGNKFGRPLQYTVAVLYLIFIAYLAINSV